jgi:hypothetical protein
MGIPIPDAARHVFLIVRSLSLAGSQRLSLLAGAALLFAAGPELALGRKVGGIGGAEDTVRTRHVDFVTSDARARLYVLDSRRSTVEEFDTTGRLLHTVGRAGEGAGEFAVPMAMAADDRGRLYVFDARLSRVSEFDLANEPRFIRHLPTEVNAADLCVMAGKLFLFGLANGKIIHPLRLAGERDAPFGDPFGPTESEMAQGSLSRGHLLCVPSLGVILVVPNVVPQIRAYSTAGALLWSRTLERYSATIVEVQGRGVTLRAPPAGFHLARSAFLAAPGMAAIQLELMSGRQVATRELRLIDLRTGAEVSASTTLPTLLAGRPPYVVATPPDSANRLDIVRFEVRNKP